MVLLSLYRCHFYGFEWSDNISFAIKSWTSSHAWCLSAACLCDKTEAESSSRALDFHNKTFQTIEILSHSFMCYMVGAVVLRYVMTERSNSPAVHNNQEYDNLGWWPLMDVFCLIFRWCQADMTQQVVGAVCCCHNACVERSVVIRCTDISSYIATYLIYALTAFVSELISISCRSNSMIKNHFISYER